MSSYFVNPLPSCYTQTSRDTGSDTSPRDYSPPTGVYGSYPTGHSTNSNYPYASTCSSPNGQNGDVYSDSPVLKRPPSREQSQVRSSMVGTTPSTRPKEGNTYPSGGKPPTPAREKSVSSDDAGSPVPDTNSEHGTTGRNANSPPPGGTTGSDSGSGGQGEKSSPSNQPIIYPWMRRMHFGHGKCVLFNSL